MRVLSRKMGLMVLCGEMLLASMPAYSFTCGKTDSTPGEPLVPGCRRLNAVVHNTTQYTFVVDTSYTAVSSSGGVAQGTNQNFTSIPPDSAQGGQPTTIFVDGAAADNDVVDTSVRYYATLNGERVGSTMTLTLQKDACYSYVPENVWNDDHCYSHNTFPTKSCSFDYTHCTQCSGNTDGVCQKDFVYKTTDCKNVQPTTASNVHSSVVVTEGLYTAGANLDTGTGVNTGMNTAIPYAADAHFACNQASECGYTSNSHCPGGSSDDNREAKLEFYVIPSPVETLTVTFPFDARTPLTKMIQNSIYNNLNSKYIGQLGTFFSFRPVVMDETTIAFSTLCNSASCPQ